MANSISFALLALTFFVVAMVVFAVLLYLFGFYAPPSRADSAGRRPLFSLGAESCDEEARRPHNTE